MLKTSPVFYGMEVPPQDIQMLTIPVMRNGNHTWDEAIAALLQNGKCSAVYAARRFVGVVWWDALQFRYHCAVKQHYQHVGTVSSLNLERIMYACCLEWGDE